MRSACVLWQRRCFASPRRTRQSRGGRREAYEESLEFGLKCPPRLKGRSRSTIELANDWYFPMLNDSQRADFFWESLQGHVEGKTVLDIGAGCGMLSLMAAKLGARRVIAIESSRDFAELALLNREDSDFVHTIQVIHDNSAAVRLADEEKADVIVSETLGTLLLSEGMLDTIADARRRLAHPDALVIPGYGAQFATLVSSPTLGMMSACQPNAYGINISAANCLVDTGKIMSTNGRGIKLSSLPDLVRMSRRLCILSVDFESMSSDCLPYSRVFSIEAQQDGIVHAIVTSWEVRQTADALLCMSTHYEETANTSWGLVRDLHWGQGFQLVEDQDAIEHVDNYSLPAPFVVTAGEKLILTAVFSEPDRRMLQFRLQREAKNREC